MAVRTVDIDRLGSVELARQGIPFRTALIVALADGRPIGELALSVDGLDRITEAHLRALIDSQDWARTELPTAVDPMPSVSVVVTTCATPESALRTVAAVLACDPPALEVVVVENRPADSPVRGALRECFGASGGRIRYVEERRRGLAAARNAGWAVASGDVVAFTDDDVAVDRGWLGWIAHTFAAEPDAGCVTGLILPADLTTAQQVLLEQFASFGKGYERRVHRLSEATSPLFPFAAGEFGSGANTAVRADVLRSLKGFDSALGTGTAARGAEDLDLYVRVLLAGHALAYEPAAIIWHRHPDGHVQLGRRLFDYGISLSAMLTKYALLGYWPAMLRCAPVAARYLSASDSRKNMRKGPQYRQRFDWIERAGMALGPLAYGASRRAERRAGYLATGTLRNVYRPAWVGEVDVSAPVPVLEPPRTPTGTQYERARLLARSAGVPIGFVAVPLRAGTASAGVVSAQLVRQLARAGRAAEPIDATELSSPLPSISVAVCTRDRPDTLRNTLASILAVDYEDYELLVVDNSPASSATRDLVAELNDSRVHYLPEPVPGLSRARNRALASARGEVIAFTDDDVVVDRGWLRAIVRGLRRTNRVVCVTGLVVPAELDTVAQAHFEASVKWSASFAPRLFALREHARTDALFPYRAGNFGAGANFAVLTEAAIGVGAFDEALGAGSPARGGEDLDFFARVILAGHTLAYEPSSFVWHSHRSSLDALREQTFAYRCSLAAYAFKHLMTRRAMRVILAAGLARNRVEPLTQVARPLTPPMRGMLGLQIRGLAVGPAAYLGGAIRARRHPRIAAQPANRGQAPRIGTGAR